MKENNFDDYEFVMQINDVYNIDNHGTIIGGPILKGEINVKDPIYYVDENVKIESHITNMEVFGRLHEGTALKGEFISIAQTGIKRENITGKGYIVKMKEKSEAMIKIENLTKKYGDFIAVEDINFEIKKGETFALLGVNGAGKTTIIKMLSCLIQPTEGDAFLNSWSIKKDSNKIKQIINISPQETAVAGNLTVRENIEFMGEIYGISKKTSNTKIDKLQETSSKKSLSENTKVEKIQTISSEKLKKDMQEIGISEKVDSLIKQFGLSEVQNKKAKLLSGGMQRRLSIAMALVSDPQILFLDEPTLGLDVLARRELWKNIRALQGKVTILLTTHYMEEAESLSDRVGIMAHGKMLQIGTPSELIEKTKAKNFEDAFIKIAGGEVDNA